MFGRPVTTLLPSRANPGEEEHRLQLERRTGDIKKHHDQSCRRELPSLYPGQHVAVMNKDGGTWHPATVVQKVWRTKKLCGPDTEWQPSKAMQEPPSRLRRSIQPTHPVETGNQSDTLESCHDPPGLPTVAPCGTDKDTQASVDPGLQCTRYGRVTNRPAHYKDSV